MTITLYLAHGTSKAFGFMREPKGYPKLKASQLVWLPRSSVRILSQDRSQVGKWKRTELDIPAWLAKQKGLV